MQSAIASAQQSARKPLKARMLIDIDRVHAVRQQFFGVLRRALAADEYAVHLITDLARHFSRLTDQLKCNRMNIAVFLLDVNQKIAPFALVHCVCALLEADRAFRTAAHAHAAHTAGIAHINPLRLDAERTERTFINTFAAKRALCSVKQIIRIGTGIARKTLHRAGFRINIDLCARRDKKL